MHDWRVYAPDAISPCIVLFPRRAHRVNIRGGVPRRDDVMPLVDLLLHEQQRDHRGPMPDREVARLVVELLHAHDVARQRRHEPDDARPAVRLHEQQRQRLQRRPVERDRHDVGMFCDHDPAARTGWMHGL